MRPAELARDLASLVVPPTCAVCTAACAPATVLCDGCERALARGRGRGLVVAGVDSAWAARTYDGPARDLVGAIKFRRLVPAARRAAALIAAEAPPGLLVGEIVPVPADSVRAAWRGFDTAERLAADLGRAAGLPMTRCLSRRHHRRQVGRGRSERLASPPRARAVGTVPAVALLVDDVSTTGATLAACAAALRTGGCRRVHAVVLAAAHA
jgi:predicted amidophosphoribosyltransferase